MPFSAMITLLLIHVMYTLNSSSSRSIVYETYLTGRLGSKAVSDMILGLAISCLVRVIRSFSGLCGIWC